GNRRAGLADHLCVDAELDVFRDEQAAGLEHLVPGQSPLGAVDLALGLGSETRVAPRVGHGPGHFCREGDGVRGASDREVTPDLQVVAVAGYGGRLEGDVGVVVRVEEVGAAEVRVTIRRAGGDARDIDLRQDAGGDAGGV